MGSVMDPPIHIEFPAVKAGLDVWACYGPFTSEGDPARVVKVASECEMTTAKTLCDAYAVTPGQFTGALEFRACDGTGMVRIRRDVVAQ